MPIYEYMTALLFHEAIKDPESKSAERVWKSTWLLGWPGAEKFEERSGDISATTLLNEFGRDGWRLVNTRVDDTGIAGGHGLKEVGTPLSTIWTLMREVAS